MKLAYYVMICNIGQYWMLHYYVSMHTDVILHMAVWQSADTDMTEWCTQSTDLPMFWDLIIFLHCHLQPCATCQLHPVSPLYHMQRVPSSPYAMRALYVLPIQCRQGKKLHDTPAVSTLSKPKNTAELYYIVNTQSTTGHSWLCGHPALFNSMSICNRLWTQQRDRHGYRLPIHSLLLCPAWAMCETLWPLTTRLWCSPLCGALLGGREAYSGIWGVQWWGQQMHSACFKTWPNPNEWHPVQGLHGTVKCEIQQVILLKRESIPRKSKLYLLKKRCKCNVPCRQPPACNVLI